MRRRRRGRLQWIALASPSEVARGRIISFLLMSSTSWEGGESITLLLFSSLSLLLLAATAAAAARLKGTYVYCIRDERHNNLPLHTHTHTLTQLLIRSLSLSLSLPLCVCLSHTHFLLGWVYLGRQLPCCKIFLRDEVLFFSP